MGLGIEVSLITEYKIYFRILYCGEKFNFWTKYNKA